MSTTAGAEVRRFSLQEHSRVRAINLRWLLPALFAAAAVLYPALVQAQPELQVSIDVSAPKAFSLTQLQSLPQVEAEVTVRSGTVERWRGTPITEVLKAAGLVASTSEALRLIGQGAVKIDGTRLEDKARRLMAGDTVVLQVGKRRFARVTAV